MKAIGAFGHWLRADFRNRVLAGILVALPIGATFFVLRFLLRLMENLGSPVVRRLFQVDFPGLGVLLTILAVYGAGLFATNVIGRRMIHWLEASVLGRLPLVSRVYPAIKKLVQTLSRRETPSFKRVVLLEFPRPGIRSIGFVTGETQDPTSARCLLSIFIPTVPNPTSGLLQLVPAEEVTDTGLSIEEGIRIVVSGGFLSAERLSVP